MINGEQGVGPGDRFIAQQLLGVDAKIPVVCAVNKLDRLGPADGPRSWPTPAELRGVDEVFPIAPKRGTGLER